MSTQGYYRYPTIHKDRVIFVSEDDLWSVPVKGGVAQRLTSNLGPVSYPYFSPDGKLIAFIGTEEGAREVFVMDSSGGSANRLTFQGGLRTLVCGWSKDGKSILFASTEGQANPRMWRIYKIRAHGGRPEQLPVGDAILLSFGPGNRMVLGRNTADPARWKRYRGGTAGHLWIDTQGKGSFKPFLSHLKTNITSPMWINKRIYFISDHEGIGSGSGIAGEWVCGDRAARGPGAGTGCRDDTGGGESAVSAAAGTDIYRH